MKREWLAVSAATVVAVAIAFGLYSSAGRDDSHITYWAAHSIAEYGEYVNFGGHRVEMSSSLFQVLILALLGWVTRAPIPNIAGVLVLPLMVLGILSTARLSALIGNRTSIFTIGILTTSAYWLYWSLGGLDTPYAACLAAWCCLSVHRFVVAGVVRLSVWLATLASLSGVCLVRPEGGAVLLCTVLGALCIVWLRPALVESASRTKKRLLMVASLSAGLVGLIVLVRLAYFGQVLPQPVYAKAGAPIYESTGILRSGWTYFSEISPWVLPFFAAAVCGMVWLLGESVLRRRSLPVGTLLASMYVLAVIGFIYWSRGDWMEGGRFFVPMIPLLAMFAGHLLDRTPKGAWVLWGLLLGCQLGSNVEFARERSTGLPLSGAIRAFRATGDHPDGATLSWFERTNRVHIRDIATIEPLNHWIRQVGAQRPGPVTILSRQMGMVLYHAAVQNFGDIDVLDRRGLADKRLLECPASSWLRLFPVGLDLQYKYLFDHFDEYQACGIRQPDIVFDFGDPSVLQAYGYRIVYFQHGTLRSAFRWSSTRNVISGQQWVAVRGELVPDQLRTKQVNVEFLMGNGG